MTSLYRALRTYLDVSEKLEKWSYHSGGIWRAKYTDEVKELEDKLILELLKAVAERADKDG